MSTFWRDLLRALSRTSTPVDHVTPVPVTCRCTSCGAVCEYGDDGRLVPHVAPSSLSNIPGPLLCHQQGPQRGAAS